MSGGPAGSDLSKPAAPPGRLGIDKYRFEEVFRVRPSGKPKDSSAAWGINERIAAF